MQSNNWSRWAAFGALAFTIVAPHSSAAAAPEVVPGQIVVGFRSADALETKAADAANGIGLVLGHQRKLRATRMRLNRGMTLDAALARLRKRSDVAYAEPVYVLRAYSTPNDSSYNRQWSLPKIQADRAWDVWQPQSKITLAIVDTGIDQTHPDLINVLLRDSGGNVIGYNAQTNVATGSAASDDNGHGTHCAGTAAGQVNNAKGIAGVAGWNPAVPNSNSYVQLMPVKVLDSDGSGTDADVAEGIIWATDHGARVISMSLGGAGSSTTLSNAVSYARTHGVVIAAAAGNESTSVKSYPAAYTGVISVAATDSTDTLAYFSNYGTWVKVAAPGVSIYNTYPGGSYSTMSGTSMATPHVAGEAAAILAQNPSLSTSQVESLIVGNVDAYTPFNGLTLAAGAGRINVYKALVAAGGGAASVSLSSLTLSPTSVQGGGSSTGTLILTGSAPTGGTQVSLFSDSTSASVPSTVTVPAGQSSTTFAVATIPVTTASSATITATAGSVSRTATLQVTAPAATIALSSVGIAPASIASGATATGTVTLSGLAGVGGAVVTLSSSNAAAATVAGSVTVPAGSQSATFAVVGKTVAANTAVTVTASYGGVTRTADVTVNKPTTAAIASVSLNPSTVTGGSSSTGSVTLSAPAPSGGAVVTLSDNSSNSSVPASVTVPAGATSATFSVGTSAVTSTTSATISGSYGGVTRSAVLAINAPAFTVRLTVSPSTVTGGSASVGTVTLSARAPSGGLTLTIASSSASVSVPSSLLIPAGYSGRTFSVSTRPVSTTTTVTITATVSGSSSTAALTVRPPSVRKVTLSPAKVKAGGNTTATVYLVSAAPSGGVPVTVTCTSSAATAPTSVTVPAGAKKVSFKVHTSGGRSATTVQVRATTGDVGSSTSLKILAAKASSARGLTGSILGR